MLMFKHQGAEFHITNVCNLNCTNCDRFNNFAFSGHQRWQDFQHIYKEWSKKITLDRIGIIGGEPLLNPTLLDWVNGLLELWPNTRLNILTNGTQLSRWPKLYQILLDNKDYARLKVSIHGKTLKYSIIDNIEKFLVAPIIKTYDSEIFADEHWQKMWEVIRGPDWPDCLSAKDFYLIPENIRKECEEYHDLGPQVWIDANGVCTEVTMNNYFSKSAILVNDNQELSLHNSNPNKAVRHCISKFCTNFSRGKLYKCPIMVALPEFDKQFYINVSDEDRQLINSYQAAEYWWTDSDLETFLTGLKNGDPIPQCKFCPEENVVAQFDAGTKKIKLEKRIKMRD